MKRNSLGLAILLVGTLALAWSGSGRAHIVLPTQPDPFQEVERTGAEWLEECTRELNALEFNIEEQLAVMDRRNMEEVAYFFYRRLRSIMALLNMYAHKENLGSGDLTRDEVVGAVISGIAADCASGLALDGGRR